MSRRFGRNQRRRAREALAEVQLALADTQLQLRRALSTGRFMRAEIEEAQRRLAQYTYIFHPKILNISRAPFRHGAEMIQVSRPEFIGISLDRFTNGFEAHLTREFTPRDPLPVMLASSRLNPLNGSTHVKVRYGDGQWGYGISPDVFQYEDRDELVGVVARELAELITHDMQRESSKVR